MTRWSDCYDIESDAVVLHVHVQPRAGRTAVVGRHGDALKLRIAAPPVDDRANAAAAELLAEMAGLAPSAVTLVSGGRSRMKRFRLRGVAPPALEVAIEAALVTPGRPGRARR
jgi:uncharacterized protein